MFFKIQYLFQFYALIIEMNHFKHLWGVHARMKIQSIVEYTSIQETIKTLN